MIVKKIEKYCFGILFVRQKYSGGLDPLKESVFGWPYQQT